MPRRERINRYWNPHETRYNAIVPPRGDFGDGRHRGSRGGTLFAHFGYSLLRRSVTIAKIRPLLTRPARRAGLMPRRAGFQPAVHMAGQKTCPTGNGQE